MNINVSQLFTVDLPFLEIFVRGTLMYLGVFVILRVILRREAGSVGVPDLLMVTLIADAAQNGMAGEYRSISAGLVLVLVLVLWNFILDFLSSRVRWFEQLVRSKPLCLVRNGHLLLHNMRTASMSHSELKALLREEGVDQLKDIKYAYLESDGKLSVIEKK